MCLRVSQLSPLPVATFFHKLSRTSSLFFRLYNLFTVGTAWHWPLVSALRRGKNGWNCTSSLPHAHTSLTIFASYRHIHAPQHRSLSSLLLILLSAFSFSRIFYNLMPSRVFFLPNFITHFSPSASTFRSSHHPPFPSLSSHFSLTLIIELAVFAVYKLNMSLDGVTAYAFHIAGCSKCFD